MMWTSSFVWTTVVALAHLSFIAIPGSGSDSTAEQAETRLIARPVAEAIKLAFVVDATWPSPSEDSLAKARRFVEAFYSQEHVYVVRLPTAPKAEGSMSVRATFDAWVQKGKYTNVFAAPEDPRTGGSSTLEAKIMVAKHLLTQHRSWDYLVDVKDADLPLLPIGALARWLGIINGTSLVVLATGTRVIAPSVLTRSLISEVFDGLRKGATASKGDESSELSRGALLRKAWAAAKMQARGADGANRAWVSFWQTALEQCVCDDKGFFAPPGVDALALFFEASVDGHSDNRAVQVRETPDWSIISPVVAFDAGHRFESVEAAWWTRHKNLLQWVLHALFVQRSTGEQRVQEVHSAARRLQARQRAKRSSRAAVDGTLVERALQATQQFQIRVTFAPADGICNVPGATSGAIFQLSSCSVEAEVFLSERLFMMPWPSSLPSQTAEGCYAHCTAPAMLLRVGTQWDGDREVFDGFTSLIPKETVRDLWVVIYFLRPIGKGADGAFSLHIEWNDPEDESLYEGGGRVDVASTSFRRGLVWERYLGPSLGVGTHSVTIRVAGKLLAQRNFEIVADASHMTSAERLKLFPQYFELLTEPDGEQGGDSPSEGLRGVSSHGGMLRVETSGPARKGPHSNDGEPDTSGMNDEAASPPSRPRPPFPPQSAPRPDVEQRKKPRSIEEIRAARLREQKTGAAEQDHKGAAASSKNDQADRKVSKTAVEAPSTAASGRSNEATSTAPQTHRPNIVKPDLPLGRRPKLSPEERQRREQEWINRDVARHAMPRLSGIDGGAEIVAKIQAGKRDVRLVRPGGSSTDVRQSSQTRERHSKAMSHQERKRRELDWIRRDVELHVPQGKLTPKLLNSLQQHAPSVPMQASTGVGSAGVASTLSQPPSQKTPLAQPADSNPREPLRETPGTQKLDPRERAWIQREAGHLRKIAAARNAAEPVKTTDGASAVESAPPARSRLKPQSAKEWESREKEWILRDIELHAPVGRLSLLSCKASVTSNLSDERLADGDDSQTKAASPPEAKHLSGVVPVEEGPTQKEAAELAAVAAEVELVRQRAGLADSPPCNELRATAPAGRVVNASGHNRKVRMNGDVEAAAMEANISMEALAEAREELRGKVPEDVIERELPWILRDIAVGRRLRDKVAR